MPDLEKRLIAKVSILNISIRDRHRNFRELASGWGRPFKREPDRPAIFFGKPAKTLAQRKRQEVKPALSLENRKKTLLIRGIPRNQPHRSPI